MSVPEQGTSEGQRGPSSVGVSRATLFTGSLALVGAITGSAMGVAELAASADERRSPAHDAEILQFGLLIERLQAAFYAEALRKGRLSGETHQFAQVVGAQEQAHVKYISAALGSQAGKSPGFHFGDVTSDPSKFISTAITLEQTGLAVYNGQAVNLTPKTLAAAARLVSVEARHAAWARAITGQDPAPVAVDVPITVASAKQVFERYLA